MTITEDYFQLVQQYHAEYGENMILLMQVGAFYEMYGTKDVDTGVITSSKIEVFTTLCELNITEYPMSSAVRNNNILMQAGVRDHAVEKYIKKLQNAGFTVVIFNQDSNTKNTTRSLAGVFSPGTYFPDETQQLSNLISCIWINFVDNKILSKGKFIIVGVACIDIYTGKSNIFQFKEEYNKNLTMYDELERFISVYFPSEAIIIANLPEEQNLTDALTYIGLNYCQNVHKIFIGTNTGNDIRVEKVNKCEKQSYQKEILSRFYQFTDYNTFIQSFNDLDIAIQSFCYLLDFVHKHNPCLLRKIAEPSFDNCSTKLVLATHSLIQLNMINEGNNNSGIGKSKMCISHMLNECLTPMGKRKFMYNILNPTCDCDYLQREYNIMEWFLKPENYKRYELYLKGELSMIKDLSKYTRQVLLATIPPKSFYLIHKNIINIKKMFDKI